MLVRIAKRFALFLVIVLGFIGCRQSPELARPWSEPLAWSPGASAAAGKRDAKPLPESAEDGLSEQQRAALEKVRHAPVTVVMPPKFVEFPAKREFYTNWFFRGYTFTKATGWRHHYHSLYQNVTPDRRPIIEGWPDGQCEADIERIEAAVGRAAAKSQSGTQQQERPDGLNH